MQFIGIRIYVVMTGHLVLYMNTSFPFPHVRIPDENKNKYAAYNDLGFEIKDVTQDDAGIYCARQTSDVVICSYVHILIAQSCGKGPEKNRAECIKSLSVMFVLGLVVCLIILRLF